MPYIYSWVDPDVYLVHRGIAVYHTYEDDIYDDQLSRYFTTDPDYRYSEVGGDPVAFHALDLLNFYHANGTHVPDTEAVDRALLIRAIEDGYLTGEGLVLPKGDPSSSEVDL